MSPEIMILAGRSGGLDGRWHIDHLFAPMSVASVILIIFFFVLRR